MNIFSGGISRRELLRAGTALGATLSGLGIVSGYAATDTHKDNITPAMVDLKYKIHPPKEGCLVGFAKPDSPSISINHYKNSFDVKPSIFVLWNLLSEGFPAVKAETIKENGVMPYIHIYPGLYSEKGLKEIFSPNDIIKGRCDRYINMLAEDAVRYGKKHGGFFFTTMVEFNADWWPWSRTSYTTPAAKHIWQIFEDHGANKYATWVWEAFCPARYGKYVDDPESNSYYPGDKYIDWIGMNVFANLKNKHISEGTMFRDLLTPTYEQMIKYHPDKPMMISEFGRTPGKNQPSWLIDAYGSMKKEFPRIKSSIYYDNITKLTTHGGQDHTLDTISLNALKDVFRDPYWIMAK